ncbi:hypothetical protein FHS31_002428 [Sphingomonas vulcanisoli]|uniref:Uncharacterized protein n=1 Tax=Sphingomonas vulcanisoli TaxID=1658060 RepID=A0ABX0TVT3_9SPHN|nr:hypothetical protein [Sphingomonas vulcanisoli]NIJ08804.1 hypothetical protein [Sphingomonas vulcanisoli]
MKPEFKIEGREATPAEYAQLMQALLASQAATPTARACAGGDADAHAVSPIDALFPETARTEARGKDGERAVYPPVSGFFEGGSSNSSMSAAPPRAAPGRYE